MNVRQRLFARAYARVAPAMDRHGLADYRRALLNGLTGRVIEVGAGTGLNFAHYPPEVEYVLAVEPEPYLRLIARQNAGRAGVAVDVVDGLAGDLPNDGTVFDAAVASLVLCSVPEPLMALRQMHRVLRSGGQLRFLEHVRADTRALSRFERVLDATVWPGICGGCHLSRDTAAAIRDGGFRIDRMDQILFPPTRPRLPGSCHIVGTAIRP